MRIQAKNSIAPVLFMLSILFILGFAPGGASAENWSTPEGGFIVFNYGDSEAIGVKDDIAEVMFKEFYDLKDYWKKNT